MAGGLADSFYSHLDVGLPAFYHQSELLSGPLRQGEDVANRAHCIRHEQHGCGGFNRDRRASVDTFEAALNPLHVKIVLEEFPPAQT